MRCCRRMNLNDSGLKVDQSGNATRAIVTGHLDFELETRCFGWETASRLFAWRRVKYFFECYYDTRTMTCLIGYSSLVFLCLVYAWKIDNRAAGRTINAGTLNPLLNLNHRKVSAMDTVHRRYFLEKYIASLYSRSTQNSMEKDCWQKGGCEIRRGFPKGRMWISSSFRRMKVNNT